MAIEQEDDDQDLEDDDLTPEQKAQKTHQELSDGADRALNRWAEAQPVEVQQAVVDTFAETGVIDFEAAGVDQLEAQVVEAAFTQRLVRSVLAPVGLTLESWSEHIDEAELSEFRRAVVRGDWALLTRHAQAAAKMRLDLGI
ncbi:hypothetical protein [Mesorhizobium ventifaucium]|uniref:Uncharacterized protein n=1 Tax=Mesorhizobium ventifaucium TaxID=666020 RepID=A0ABM9DEG5_9HYPH|nr:hypothetical protein [Mesorhizobium ventifaucium]CAH2394512.1 conserved hypothetical protein [Mesorhizobium ventifaucium]